MQVYQKTILGPPKRQYIPGKLRYGSVIALVEAHKAWKIYCGAENQFIEAN